MKKINLSIEIKSIIYFLLLFFWIQLIIWLLIDLFPAWLNFIDNIFNDSPLYIKFLFSFSIQEIFLFILLYLSLKYYFSDDYSFSIDEIFSFYKWKFNWYGRWNVFKYVIWWFFVYIIISWILHNILELYSTQMPWLFWEQKVATVLSNLQWNGFFDNFVLYMWVAVIWPFVEELIFRWFISDFLFKKYSKISAILISSFIFSFIHLERAVFFNLFILAIILTYIYYKTNSLIYTFLFHFIINGLGVIWIMLIS